MHCMCLECLTHTRQLVSASCSSCQQWWIRKKKRPHCLKPSMASSALTFLEACSALRPWSGPLLYALPAPVSSNLRFSLRLDTYSCV